MTVIGNKTRMVGAGVLAYLLEHGQVHTVNRFCTRQCQAPVDEDVF
jgi:hypothetical protein